MPYLLSVALLGANCVKSAENAGFPAWAFPRCDRTPPAIEPDNSRPLSVQGSKVHFTAADLARASVALDWFPPDHAKMPAVVAVNRSDQKIACGYCHLPDGSGRPENAKIAGLSTAYIIAQVRSIHTEERRPAERGWAPSALMKDAIADLTDQEIALAAEYFSSQKTKSFVRVVEREYVPQHGVLCGVFIPREGATTAVHSLARGVMARTCAAARSSRGRHWRGDSRAIYSVSSTGLSPAREPVIPRSPCSPWLRI